MSVSLPKIMKKGSWDRDIEFSSFILNNEEITIDTEEKYLYWTAKVNNRDDKDVNFLLNNDFVNFGKLWLALEDFLYVTHQIDDSNWNK